MKKPAGIDIGTYSIKLIELEEQKGRLDLALCAEQIIEKGDVKLALKDMLAHLKPHLKNVNVSLSGHSVVVRYIEMPPMRKDELKSAVRFEAEKYIPFDINDSIIDCTALDKTSSGSQRVLVAVAKKGVVNNLLELFKEFNLEIMVVDIDCFALLNSFQRTGVEKDGRTYALINLGHTFSNMNIVTGNNVYFTRDIVWGGVNVTNRIKDVMALNPQEAEALKRNPGEKRQQVTDVIMPVLDRYISQIRMSFDYFESQFGKNVEKIYLSGSGVYLFNIVDTFKDSLGIEAAIWNPFEAAAITAPALEKIIGAFPARFSVAMGLAMRK